MLRTFGQLEQVLQAFGCRPISDVKTLKGNWTSNEQLKQDKARHIAHDWQCIWHAAL